VPVLCNFVTMSAIVSARTLDDEAVSVTNFEATLNKRDREDEKEGAQVHQDGLYLPPFHARRDCSNSRNCVVKYTCRTAIPIPIRIAATRAKRATLRL
jgi:hypothetical protein